MDPYFLYCGDSTYYEPIELLIKAFSILNHENNRIQLLLVLHGPDKTIARIENLIKKLNCDTKISIKQHLPFSELIEEYQGAAALLIPLRPDKQDTARFPHKIGEYIATGRPIITGDVGEVGRYFAPGINAFLAQEFTPQSYADQMGLVVDNLEEADRVGRQGRQLGKNFFNYKIYGRKISQFLDKL